MAAQLSLVAGLVPVSSAVSDYEDGGEIDPLSFLRTESLRRLLSKGPIARQTVERTWRCEWSDLEFQVGLLRAWGLMTRPAKEEDEDDPSPRIPLELTSEGYRSLRWAAPPKPEGDTEEGWAARLVRAISSHHGVEPYEMFHDAHGAAVKARSRLCAAFYRRGWSSARISMRWGIRVDWVRNAIERWGA